jgi:lipopolysaccharide/colanic/teichoic acid biosynthesis glycosyltransferase
MIKRLFDFFLSFFLISLFLPIYVIISVLVILDDGWPVFFVQQRVGLKSRLFRIYKFRTMTVRKDASLGSFDAGDSSRVTRVGRILRKTKLDEIPQLVNVLLGDMSFVGPRPEVQKWVTVYPERWAIVHSLKPGITDNASLEFKNEEEILAVSQDKENTYRNQILPRKLDLYEQYVLENSFFGDLLIILKTGFSILFK